MNEDVKFDRRTLVNTLLASLAITSAATQNASAQDTIPDKPKPRPKAPSPSPHVSPKGVEKFDKLADVPLNKSRPHLPDTGNVVETSVFNSNEHIIELKNKLSEFLKEFFEDRNAVPRDSSISNLESQIEIDLEKLAVSFKSFSPCKVEVLLNQSADLFERALSDRNEWDLKSIELFKLVLELNEFMLLDDNLLEQIEKGLYQIEIDEVVNLLAGENILESKLRDSIANTKKLIDEKYGDASISNVNESIKMLNFASLFFADYASTSRDAAGPTHNQLNFGGVVQYPYQLGETAQLALNSFNMKIQKIISETQLIALESSDDVSKNRKKFLEKKLKWLKENIKAKLQRDQILRSTSIYKLSSLISDDGILNYKKRLLPLKERFTNDFAEAYARLKSAELGLNRIYGYEKKLPPLSAQNVADSKFFDDCIVWNRDAINFVNKFSQNEVYIRKIISIRDYVSDGEKFKRGFYNGKWDINVTNEYLVDKYHARLRGVSVSVVGLGKHLKNPHDLEGNISSNITMQSSELLYLHHTGYVALDIKEFQHTKSVSMGRVFSTSHPRSGEIVGSEVFFNMSPVGNWTIKLEPISRNFYWEKKGRRRYKRKDWPATIEVGNSGGNEEFPLFYEDDFFDIQLELHLLVKRAT
ncbi:hypothetical protein [Dyadobacter sp. BHUBP1]|uniref:hypothetical protein n=1 Tax=Dyadobacter sp. BHUBP1 TaxID=3424178 RepID=UPI003D34A104